MSDYTSVPLAARISLDEHMAVTISKWRELTDIVTNLLEQREYVRVDKLASDIGSVHATLLSLVSQAAFVQMFDSYVTKHGGDHD